MCDTALLKTNASEVFDYSSWDSGSPQFIDSDLPSTSLDSSIRPSIARYFVLESESSNTEGDTESIDSLQNKETDCARNTSDTDSKSSDYDIEIEYEVASTEEGEGDELNIFSSNDSCDEEQIMMAAAAVLLNQVDLSVFAPAASDDDDGVPIQAFFPLCVECKKPNDYPYYRCCNDCYKVRKSNLPPRPRKSKRNLSRPRNTSPVKIENLESCLNGMSSQNLDLDFGPECPTLDLSHIVIPDHLSPKSETSAGCPAEQTREEPRRSLKRKSPASSEDSKAPPPPLEEKKTPSPLDERKMVSVSEEEQSRSSLSESEDAVASKKMKREEEVDVTFEELKETSKVQRAELKERISVSDNDTLYKAQEERSREKRKSLPAFEDESPRKKSRLSDSTQDAMSSRSDLQLDFMLPSSSTMSSLSFESSISNTERYDLNLEIGDTCIICNAAKKNGLFIHNASAHLCCCYPCANKTYRTTKRCPICNKKVQNVVKISRHPTNNCDN